MLDAAEESLREIRPQVSGYSIALVETGGTPLALDAAGGLLWVAQENELLGLSSSQDTATRIVSRTPLDGTPVAVSADESGAWVATREGMLARVESGRVTLAVAAPGRPIDLGLGEGALWLLTGDGKLHRLDAGSGEPQDVEDIGANPVALAVGDGIVWVVVRGGDPLRPAELPDTYRTSPRRPSATRPW